jgi:hypothetical protein
MPPGIALAAQFGRWGALCVSPSRAKLGASLQQERSGMSTEDKADTGEETYRIREAVGLLPDITSLDKAIESLIGKGFSREDLSVLSPDKSHHGVIAGQFAPSAKVMDDPDAPRTSVIDHESAMEIKAAAIGIPAQVGAFAGAIVAVASGGVLAAAIAALIAGGAAGGGLGALLSHAVSKRHREDLQRQLANGGIILWVQTPDKADEEKAMATLASCGATNIHVHEIERSWGMDDVPLARAQPDPFL